jgi:carotenoid cleavage dioxygenase-like enzyme
MTSTVTGPTTTTAPARFPDTKTFTGVNRPMRAECDVYELERAGELPADLAGALYRAGPEPAFPPRAGDDIFINGDGMVSMVAIARGHADFKTRYVRTDKLRRERQARRALFGGYRNPWTDDAAVAGMDRTTANTSTLWHAGKLFALKEDGLAHELDPLTLATRGKWDFGGKLRSKTMTAHPKIDPVTGELVFYGYAASGEMTSDVAFCVADATGKLTREDWFLPPYASVIHDWAVTEHHVVFAVMPVTTDLDRVKAGGPRWAWDGSQTTHVGILPRHGPVSDIVWFEGPPLWSFHTMNAFEEGDRVHVDLCVAEAAPFPEATGGFPAPERTRQYLTRWTFDLSRRGGGFEQERLWHLPMDFPEVDQRFQTRAYRHGFMLAKDLDRPVNPELGKGVFFNTLAHIDHETGNVETWYAGDDRGLQEPVFVPRKGSQEQGDGYLLCTVNRWPADGSELAVLDTRDLTAGPVALLDIPVHIRPTFHGCWVGEEDLGGIPEWLP